MDDEALMLGEFYEYGADDNFVSEGEPSADAPDMGDGALNARNSVEEWHIRSVGHRPVDFMARDCLFGAMFRDHRVPWFRNYVARPSAWMESLVSHLPDDKDRAQALRYVILHFLHKAHLVRIIEYFGGLEDVYDDQEPARKILTRLWNCTPYTVEVAHASQVGRAQPGCNLPRLCPWCHARKVVKLYEYLIEGPLKRPQATHLFLGKALPFPERLGGVDGSYRAIDWIDYQGPQVRGHWGRYFGRDRDRVAHTRRVLRNCLVDHAGSMGLLNGLWTHQLGSAQIENGQRTFLHDFAMIAEAHPDPENYMPTDPNNGNFFWGGDTYAYLTVPDFDLVLDIRWLPLPLDKRAAVRVALAGSSAGYAVSNLDLEEERFTTLDGYRSGIPGALSWQPTFLFDDRMWFAYAEAVKGQQLYHPFGSWRKALAEVAVASRSSVDRKFKRIQDGRFVRGRQQKGNRKRGRAVQERRAALLSIAVQVWPEVVAHKGKGPGRPNHRKRLDDMLRHRGVMPSRRDLEWLTRQLTSRQELVDRHY